jgi:hypothetical protein
MVNKEWYSKTLRKMTLAFATGVKTESKRSQKRKTLVNCEIRLNTILQYVIILAVYINVLAYMLRIQA